MENSNNKDFQLYKDIKGRTNGDIYIGVVGPIRTGKSTFINRFMDIMIIPKIDNPSEKERVIDELPQSSGGRTVMTTEPKFIPKEAVSINLGEHINAKFRLIDCVGFMIDDAQGIYEDEKERLVKTPWFPNEIPFSKAAEYGTQKVIKDHSTIGIVVTTDGTIGEFARENYYEAEEKAINELKKINKPFVVIVNSAIPEAEETKRIAQAISRKYQVAAIPVDCQNMDKGVLNEILKTILLEFPVNSIEFYMPKWVEMLPIEHPIKTELLHIARNIMDKITYIKDVVNMNFDIESEYASRLKFEDFDFYNGVQKINIYIDDKYYYENLSELCGEKIMDEYELISMIKTLSCLKKNYNRYVNAIDSAKNKGYGVVMPQKEEIILNNPELIKTNNKYGVKIKAECPSVHMIKVNIATEIAPIVGNEEQAKDLIKYINESSEKGDVWNTSIFGKSMGQLIEDGIRGKLQMLNDESQVKLQDTMQKVVNDSNGGLVCLII